MRMRSILPALLLMGLAATLLSRDAKVDPRLAGSARGAKNGWITIRLQGTPSAIGYQHGYLLGHEIEDALKVTKLNLTHDGGKDWQFYRTAAEQVFWPKIEDEYRQELQGIVDGLSDRGLKADIWDIVAMNASLELDYYKSALEKSAQSPAQDRCSAFAATGSYTKDGKIVIGHNNWSGYLEGTRWNIIYDIKPAKGQRILMDGFPGFIHSGDDFGLNSAGIVITETTISGFKGFDVNGVPEFVRARKAMQYSASIDDFDRIMREGNNGGYANAWLVADVNRNEIARLELGLKNVTLERSSDGYFTGANFPVNPKLAAEETDFKVNDPALSPNARRVRWTALMSEYKGRIDIAAGKSFLADHYDVILDRREPDERTLCGHNEVSPRGMEPWQPAFAPAGAVQSKITDAAMALQMSMEAAMGHSCGVDFRAAQHLKKYPKLAWQKPLLKDLIAQPWTPFSALEQRAQ
jgi:hypothetical protein